MLRSLIFQIIHSLHKYLMMVFILGAFGTIFWIALEPQWNFSVFFFFLFPVFSGFTCTYLLWNIFIVINFYHESVNFHKYGRSRKLMIKLHRNYWKIRSMIELLTSEKHIGLIQSVKEAHLATTPEVLYAWVLHLQKHACIHSHTKWLYIIILNSQHFAFPKS